MTAPLARPEWRKLRILIVVTLVFLTVEGWFGDTVNLFMVPASSAPLDASAGFQAVLSANATLISHAFLGLGLLGLAVVILTFSLKAKPRNVQVPAILGLVMMVSALIGGILFVLSGFSNNGVSAQMGGSFIGAYAFYFIELYYAK